MTLLHIVLNVNEVYFPIESKKNIYEFCQFLNYGKRKAILQL